MSVDLIPHPPPGPAPRIDPPIDAAPAGVEAAPVAGGRAPLVVVLPADATDTVEALLLSIAGGSREAFVVLESRMTGLVRLNVRRVLQDTSRTDAATRETFAEVLADAASFDPDRDTAEAWLLTRAHRHAVDGLGHVDNDR